MFAIIQSRETEEKEGETGRQGTDGTWETNRPGWGDRRYSLVTAGYTPTNVRGEIVSLEGTGILSK